MIPLQSEDFSKMMDDEDDTLMARAYEQIAFAMENEPIDMATALMVALRDFIADYYDDETMGFAIAKEVADGNH